MTINQLNWHFSSLQASNSNFGVPLLLLVCPLVLRKSLWGQEIFCVDKNVVEKGKGMGQYQTISFPFENFNFVPLNVRKIFFPVFAGRIIMKRIKAANVYFRKAFTG
jgi:hypothetical protein